MRLLIVNYHARLAGGTETYLQAIFPRLIAAGHTVSILSLDLRETRSEIAPPQVECLPGAGLDVTQFRQRAQDWQPDLIYLHGLGDPVYEEEIVRHFPTLYFAHNYGGFCVSGTKTHSFPEATPCSRTLGVGCLVHYLPRQCGGWNMLKAMKYYQRETHRLRVFRQARGVVVASRAMAEEVARHGIPRERIHLLPLFPPGIEPDPQPPSPRPFSNRLLFLGRMTSLKGWSHLAPALQIASEKLGRSLTLVTAGDGPDRERFQQALRQALFPVEFLGWISAAERERQTRAADLMLVPSIWPEPFGLVGIEAGCVGTPSVGYDVGGIPDWLRPGVSGELAPGDPPQPRQFAEAIARALRDAEHWQKLRTGAWHTAQEFSAQSHLDRLLKLFHATLSPASR